MNKDIIERTMPITALPIDQAVGYYVSNTSPCSIGARLAGFLLDRGDSCEGFDAFASELGCNRAQVWVLLQEAGAGNNPFGEMAWEIPPAQVWKNLLKIETLPTLAWADLLYANLRQAVLPGADLTGAVLKGADLHGANLNGAVLKGANLHSADLSWARLCEADLSGADLTNANLGHALLIDADLSGADLTDTYARKAYLNRAVLKDTDLSMADFRGAIGL